MHTLDKICEEDGEEVEKKWRVNVNDHRQRARLCMCICEKERGEERHATRVWLERIHMIIKLQINYLLMILPALDHQDPSSSSL